ncbi:MAG: general secretion pathway protein GspF [Gammaproteobacteria bacterium]|nr:general secretion pathway protein GspF [Gammaproteobacteria bacterium]MDH5803041.1 general secretion pathway protein GspF [Gammaproteobacteria bacterium]
MARKKKAYHHPDEPILHSDHKRPVSRRDFLRAGLITSSAAVMVPSLMTLTMRKAWGVTTDPFLDCGITAGAGGRKGIPFMCFDLGGGANMTGSNVLVGGPAGQEDFLSVAGYNKLGLPSDQVPSIVGVNRELGLGFHPDSAFLKGIISKTTPECRANVNGAIIPNRSDNDTANNPHNPMYGIARAGADGGLATLIGTQNSDSGGRSMSPAMMIDLTKRPTRIASPGDARGLVDTGSLGTLMPDNVEAARVMDAVRRISLAKIDGVDGSMQPTQDAVPNVLLPDDLDTTVQELVDCGYLKTADTVRKFSGPDTVDPEKDNFIFFQNSNSQLAPRDGVVAEPNGAPAASQDLATVTANSITSGQSIFTASEMNSGTFRSTASVMKLVIEGFAGAGTVSLGGYDYHDGTRATGELRDFRAGQAMGAALEYAHRLQEPLMLYVFTDGSLASNGRIDDSANGRGKGEWTGDNSSTSAAFFLVYNPTGRPQLLGGTAAEQAMHQQLGYYRSSASVETNNTTPGANNVNLLVEMVLLNYMALSGNDSAFATAFPNHGLGPQSNWTQWTAFNPIV